MVTMLQVKEIATICGISPSPMRRFFYVIGSSCGQEITAP